MKTIPILVRRNGEWVEEQYTLTPEEEAAAIAEEAQGAIEAKQAEIDSLKAQLAESDYRVIKNVEATQAGLPMPYDAEELHRERQAIRDEINQLEDEVFQH